MKILPFIFIFFNVPMNFLMNKAVWNALDLYLVLQKQSECSCIYFFFQLMSKSWAVFMILTSTSHQFHVNFVLNISIVISYSIVPVLKLTTMTISFWRGFNGFCEDCTFVVLIDKLNLGDPTWELWSEIQFWPTGSDFKKILRKGYMRQKPI